MRSVTVVLAVLLAVVQGQLWLGHNGLPHVREMRKNVAALEAANDEARLNNDRLLAEVRDLQQGLEMIEEKARMELGMVRPDEILVKYANSVR